MATMSFSPVSDTSSFPIQCYTTTIVDIVSPYMDNYSIFGHASLIKNLT